MKKILANFLAIVMFCMPLFSLAQGMQAFEKAREYIDGTFTDIDQSDWYYSDVVSAYCYGLARGKSESSFDPQGQVTIAEAVTFAVRVHSIYHNKQVESTTDDPWYADQIAYAEENGIIKPGMFAGTYDNPATRGQMAYIFASALPEVEYDIINDIKNLADVTQNDPYYDEILKLFNAGIVAGNDEYGAYSPGSNIIRAEAVTILNRVADKSRRLEFALTPITEKPPMNLLEIEQKTKQTTFRIDGYDKSGAQISTGTGFFIEENGRAITNYHLIKDAYSAAVFLTDGRKQDVSLVYGYDAASDIAVLGIDGGGVGALGLGDSDTIKNGQKIFCLQSPLEQSNTISEGILSNRSRELSGINFVQISVPVLQGNGGGPVLNEQCRVIGIVSGEVSAEHGLNLAVPINLIKQIAITPGQSLQQIYEDNLIKPPEDMVFYPGNDAVPNLSVCLNITFDTMSIDYTREGKVLYTYETRQGTVFGETATDIVSRYIKILCSIGYKESEPNILETETVYRLEKGDTTIEVHDVTALGKEAVLVDFNVGKDNVSPPVPKEFYQTGDKVPDYSYVTNQTLLRIERKEGMNTFRYAYTRTGFERYVVVELPKAGYFPLDKTEIVDPWTTVYSYRKGNIMMTVSIVHNKGYILITPGNYNSVISGK